MKIDREFMNVISGKVIGIDRCYQCFACTLGCPLAFAMDLFPHEIVRSVQLGAKDKVLQSESIWVCSSCETCATRCPYEIDIVKLMDVLRRMAVDEHADPKGNSIFNHVFLDAIRKTGRINELPLALNYKVKARRLLCLDKDEIKFAVRMFSRGKLKLFPARIRGIGIMRKIFKSARNNK
jgi:heterodisulfide reductase subunit C